MARPSKLTPERWRSVEERFHNGESSSSMAREFGVADWLGIYDGSKRLKWLYAQRKGKPGQYAAEVHVDEVPG